MLRPVEQVMGARRRWPRFGLAQRRQSKG